MIGLSMPLFRSSKSAGQRYVYVAFDATADAMACKEAFDAAGIDGRLVTVPREISAGCGYAWRSPIGERQRIENALENTSLENAGIWEL